MSPPNVGAKSAASTETSGSAFMHPGNRTPAARKAIPARNVPNGRIEPGVGHVLPVLEDFPGPAWSAGGRGLGSPLVPGRGARESNLLALPRTDRACHGVANTAAPAAARAPGMRMHHPRLAGVRTLRRVGASSARDHERHDPAAVIRRRVFRQDA